MIEDNYYENIRSYIIKEQARTIVRDYSANKSKLETYYNIGKELSEAGKHYGEGIVKKYSEKLTYEFGKGYTYSDLNRMIKLYILNQNLASMTPNFDLVPLCKIITTQKPKRNEALY